MHAVYPLFRNRARWDYPSLVFRHLFGSCTYRSLLEEIVIQVRVESISQLRLSFDYQILRNEERVAIGTTSHCFLNASFKPIPIPPDILRRLRGDLSKEFVNDGVDS